MSRAPSKLAIWNLCFCLPAGHSKNFSKLVELSQSSFSSWLDGSDESSCFLSAFCVVPSLLPASSASPSACLGSAVTVCFWSSHCQSCFHAMQKASAFYSHAMPHFSKRAKGHSKAPCQMASQMPSLLQLPALSTPKSCVIVH